MHNGKKNENLSFNIKKMSMDRRGDLLWSSLNSLSQTHVYYRVQLNGGCSLRIPHRCQFRDFSVNFWSQISIDAAPTGLRSVR